MARRYGQRFTQQAIAILDPDEVDFGAGEILSRREHVETGNGAAHDAIRDRCTLDHEIV